MENPTLVCVICEKRFKVPDWTAKLYPEWRPSCCLLCRGMAKARAEDVGDYDDEDMSDTCHPGHPSNYGDK